ncbi:MAG: antibiotic biosynthesis monooxygenase [Gammaproteobacteria bacterium]|jgi:heme oxygenase (mycobilin-producing)
MFVVTNRVPVETDWREKFEERFRQRAGQVDKQPGFLRMEIMRPVDDDTPYLVMTVWRDEKAFRDWVESDDFKLAHQNPLPKEAYKASGGGMEQHTIIVSASAE